MCGIVGSFGSPSDFIDQATALLNHRGPDSSGVWRDSDKAICLGHTRLSIQDLSHAGDQPMVSGCERYVIAFNGEIYNHLDLRTQLAESWIGHSDTETLLACISRWGLDKTLHEVIGMFAFALWDRQSRKLYLARDRIGEKPLYYGAIEGSLIFASELNPLKTHPGWSAEIDVNSLGLLLRYGYIPAPYSIYSGFRKVQPGTYLEITSPSAEPIIHEYWSRKEITDAHHDQLEGDPVVALEDLLRKSVTSQLIADVPYGAFLSGGIDSSTVVALMQAALDNPVNTFSIGFEDPNYDESGFARNVAHHLGTNHTDLVVKPEEALAVIPRIPQVYDEPFADSSQIPTYLVAQLASKDVKVVLSGDGGDELFGGYTRYLVGQCL